MGIFIRKQKEGFAFTGIAKLSITSFIMASAGALIQTIWSIYIDSFLNNASYVGFFIGILTLISFFTYFLIIPLIEKSNKSKIFLYSLFISSIVYLFFVFIKDFYLFAIIAVFAVILITIKRTSLGIIVKDKSPEKKLSRNEGLVYTFLNFAFLIGPLIAGYIAYKAGINKVFIFVALFYFLAFVFFKFSKIKDANIKKKADINFFKNFVDFFKSRDRVVAYMLGGGVNLWWTLIYIFIPIFMIRNGLNEKHIGIFLFAVVIPLILTEYSFSKFAGKIGFKKIFKIGFFIVFLTSLFAFFVSSNIYLVLTLLVLASFGMAMVEPTTEAYFFDISTSAEELRFYGPYNTTIDINYFIGSVLSATILIFLPFRFIFLLFAFFMFVMFLISFAVRNVIEERRDGKKNK